MQPATDSDKETVNSHDAELAKQYAKTSFLQKFVLEIALSLFALGTTAITIPMNAIYQKKACLYLIGYDESICDTINVNTTINAEVQSYTKSYMSANQFVPSVTGVVMCVIMGQYTARYGCKFPVVSSLIGGLLTTALQAYTLYELSVPLPFSVLALVPMGVTGGLVVFTTTVFSNISNSCPADARKLRMMMINFFMFAAGTIATAAGVPVSNKYGVLVLGAAACIVILIGLILVIYFFQDMDQFKLAQRDSFKEIIHHSVSLETLKQSVTYVVKVRPSYGRLQLICMISCVVISAFGLSATSDFNFLVTSLYYHWSPEKISMAITCIMAGTFVLTFPTILFITKIWKLNDPWLLTVGYITFCARYFLMTIMSLGEWVFFAQAAIVIPYSVAVAGVRSHISKILRPSEVSVIFALLASLEKAVPIVPDILIGLMYEATVRTFPELTFIVLGIICIIPVLLGVTTALLVKNYGLPAYDDDADDSVQTGREESLEMQKNSSKL